MNRAPSPRDPWWAEHAARCGGSYIKVSAPEISKGADHGSCARGEQSKGSKRKGKEDSEAHKERGQEKIEDSFKKLGKRNVCAREQSCNGIDKHREEGITRSLALGAQVETEGARISIGDEIVLGHVALMDKGGGGCESDWEGWENESLWLEARKNHFSDDKDGRQLGVAARNEYVTVLCGDADRDCAKESLHIDDTEDVEELVACPACGERLEHRRINSHLDICLAM